MSSLYWCKCMGYAPRTGDFFITGVQVFHKDKKFFKKIKKEEFCFCPVCGEERPYGTIVGPENNTTNNELT